MGLDHSLVGVPSEPHLRSWDSKDALLYAVGVGAGLGDPLQELEFTTENCEGIEQQVLPTYAVLIAQAPMSRSLGDFDRAMLVHAEQYFELHRPLPVAGTVSTTSTVTGIYDKGSGALVVTENVAVDAATGEPLVTSGAARSSAARADSAAPAAPTRRGSCRTARPTTRSSARPGRSRRCSTGSPATATRCTSIPSSPPAAASASRSCTACAPTGSPAGPCCGCCATATRPGSAPCPAASPARCCQASR